MTSRDHRLLLDLMEQGAALTDDLRPWFPSASALRMRVLQLARAGYVEAVGRHGGQRIFALAPRGKRHLGINSNWRTRSQEAFRQVLWRRCHAQLVAEGYRHTGPWHGGLVLYRGTSGPALAVQVLGARPSTRYIRTFIKQHRPALIREGTVLCVFSPSEFEFAEVGGWLPVGCVETRHLSVRIQGVCRAR